MTAILFVCLGNICRSPTAQAVFTRIAAREGLGDIEIESAGTGAWHAGELPDARSREAGIARGYSFEGQVARQVESLDFARFDYILAMDSKNLSALKAMQPKNWNAHLGLFLDFSDTPGADVPDPYYGGPDGFEDVITLIERASRGLAAHIKSTGGAPQ